MKALVGAFNQEKALVGAFSVIVKTGCGTDGALILHHTQQHTTLLMLAPATTNTRSPGPQPFPETGSWKHDVGRHGSEYQSVPYIVHQWSSNM